MCSSTKCHVCRDGNLNILSSFTDFHQVSSDCKPWKTGGAKGCCSECGTVQAVMDATWREACHQIYSSYAVYHQGGGAEQAVFDLNSNAGTPRSLKLLKKMIETVDLTQTGRALDIGCGNGNFLRSLSVVRPKWLLNGAEYNTIYREQVLSIPGVEAFYSGPMESIPGSFDFVSLIHVLEHIEDPIPFLQKIAMLAPRGTLLIEVPFFRDNPYELLIADHATHYTPDTLRRVLQSAGYSIQSIQTDWIVKEISAVAIASVSPDELSTVSPKAELEHAEAAAGFLGRIRNKAKDLRSRSKSFGVFGTSIGGTWLHSELKGKVDFFVDEDSSRVGKKHLDVAIVSPAQIPRGSSVFMPLAGRIVGSVAERLRDVSPGVDYVFMDQNSE